jgi:beta-N-acetylhexosaminidase
MALVCNNPQGAQQVLDGLGPHNDPASHARLIRMHGRGVIDRAQLQQQTQWHQAVARLDELSEDTTLDLGLA